MGEDKDTGNGANQAEVKSTEIWNTQANRNMRSIIKIIEYQIHNTTGEWGWSKGGQGPWKCCDSSRGEKYRNMEYKGKQKYEKYNQDNRIPITQYNREVGLVWGRTRTLEMLQIQQR